MPLALPPLSPAEALLRLRRAGLPHLALLESLGPITAHSRFTCLSAAPSCIQLELPLRPSADTFFPAWLGGLKYEAAARFGLQVRSAAGEAQWWGYYPSGLIWDRQLGTLELVGTPHLDWLAVLKEPEGPPPELHVGPFSADDLNYPAGVQAIQELIKAGEVYQVNLSRGVQAGAQGDPLAAYLRLRQLNPSPYMAYLEASEEVVVSCSPEQLCAWESGAVSARPIAGTRRRGHTPQEDAALQSELLSSSKERAEHVMLLDLLRHDLGGAAAPGSVHVPELLVVERYSHVMHLVSQVQGQAKADLSTETLLGATFPGGTITGAPKQRVMQAIAALETQPRGWYTGSLGLISGRKVEFNILIRTAAFQRAANGWTVQVRSGGGTVIDSDPHHEAEETVHKARALLQALSADASPPRAPAPPVGQGAWAPAPVSERFALRVLLLDNRDSFTHNLLHDLWALGAAVTLRGQDDSVADLLAGAPQAVLVGPGPGTPQSSGATLALTRACLSLSLPLLGVCLGHQALGEVLGGRVERALPVHGQAARVQHSGTGLFEGVAQGALFGRYHSLAVRGLAPELVSARSESGEIMAIDAAPHLAWGVQFHPESVLSPAGRQLLSNWLRLASAAAPPST